MAHLQYMPGDPRLVDQLVYELKSKGIFDQFRKECIADVDTRPAYQNLRQRVESSVSSFLSRQCWKPDLNKNQLREKLRKHILDGNYLEQGLERIVDQVVNPKVAPVFIPQVEDLVYNFLGITRKKQSAETSTEKSEKNENSLDDLLPTDLEAVSPGSVKSHDGAYDATHDPTEENMVEPMEIDQEPKEVKPKEEEATVAVEDEKEKNEQVHDVQMSDTKESINTELEEKDKQSIPLPGEIKLENIVPPQNTPPKIDLEKIELPKEVIESKPTIAIPLPEEPKGEKDIYFKPITANSDDDESSSDSSLRRNMSPLTPIRNFINENSCDAQQGFENDSDNKYEEKKEQPSTFRFAIENKSAENSSDVVKPEKKDDQANLAYQFNNQVNINNFNTPMYDDSSNSNNLQIDYESDANSKINVENKQMETENSEDSKRERKSEDKRSSHKSSHRSRDSHRQSSSKDKRSDSKHSTSRESSRHDKKSKDDRSKSKSSHREREKSKDRSDKKDSRDSKHRSSHKSSSSSKDSKSHRSSSSSQRHSSKHDDKKSSSSHKDKNDKSSDKSSRDKKDSKSSSHRSDKDKKSSSKSKSDDKDKKKDKKDTDDHYSVSGRGNNSRRSTDRDSNDGSSSSKSSHNPASSKASENKNKENKESSSKSDNTSTSGESTSPSDKEILLAQLENDSVNTPAVKPVRVDTHLEIPIASPPRLPFVPDLTLRKPKFAANLEEAKKFIKMRKFLDEEQKRMNQEAALLLEFQANVRPSLSQVYSSIPGPELEFACINKNHIEYQPPQRERKEQSTLILENHLEPKILLENLDVDAIKDIIGVTNEVEEPIEECNASFDDELRKVEHTVVETENIDSEHSVIKDEDNEVLGNDAMKSNEVTQNGCDLKDVKEIKNETYEENKPFSQLVDEIMQYGKASERMKMNNEKPNCESPEKVRSDLFEVTIITEELSENEEVENNQSELENGEGPKETLLHYFDEQEVIDAELQRHKFRNFLKRCPTHLASSNKMYLINCGTYEENIFKEVSGTFGNYEVVNYHRNGHLKLPNKNIVKDVNLESEITLPVDSADSDTTVSNTPVFSPVKSECSFELSSDYDAKLEEMVNKTSRQEIMEIILGSAVDESPSKAPKINYCVDPFIANDNVLKRKVNEVDSTMNNNKHVLTTTNKIRKLSGSDQITSTTEEPEEVSNNNRIPISTRSKYLGRAKRVGLPRPRKTNLPNSPSSDKSVENYEEDTTKHTPNGKIKTPQRSKFQRYDTTDLYKPKLHYLSRRNNVS